MAVGVASRRLGGRSCGLFPPLEPLPQPRRTGAVHAGQRRDELHCRPQRHHGRGVHPGQNVQPSTALPPVGELGAGLAQTLRAVWTPMAGYAATSSRVNRKSMRMSRFVRSGQCNVIGQDPRCRATTVAAAARSQSRSAMPARTAGGRGRDAGWPPITRLVRCCGCSGGRRVGRGSR
jgi:hypothetical protein